MPARAQLLAFAGDAQEHNRPEHIRFDFADSLKLVDWTGRQLRDDKRGAIDQALPPFSHASESAPSAGSTTANT